MLGHSRSLGRRRFAHRWAGHSRLWTPQARLGGPGQARPSRVEPPCHGRRPDPPPDADELPQLPRGEPRRRRPSGRAHRTERRRQDQPDRSDFAPGAGPRACAAPPSTRSRSPRATAPGRSRPRSRACWVSPRSAPASSRPRARTPARTRAMPNRSRAGRFGGGLRRPSAGDLAYPGHGSAVRRAGLGAAALPRPPGARGRRRAHRAGFCARARAALAQPAAGGAAPRSALARRHRARDRRARGRGRGAARRNRAPVARRAGRAQGRRIPIRRDRARRLDGAAAPEHPAVEIEERYRGILKDNRAKDAAAGRTLDGPHLTDLAVSYSPKNIPAADASTGEQKALLIGLVLAHAGLLADMTGFAPVLLLDEVVAHLDPARRLALYGASRHSAPRCS